MAAIVVAAGKQTLATFALRTHGRAERTYSALRPDRAVMRRAVRSYRRLYQLIEQGKIDLDAPVGEYWPEFAQAGKKSIPVRWLLTHQAGLPAIAKPLPEETLFDWDAMTSALAEQAPWWEPGTERAYRPITCGHLVGEVVRRVSGQSLGNFFRERVAEPLDADFHIGLAEEDEPRVADILG